MNRPRLVWIAAALGAAALLSVVLRPSPVVVETASVVRGGLRVSVEAEGKTRVRDRFVLSTPVAGRLGRIELREGDVVERGAVVARLAPLPLDERARSETRARLDSAVAAEHASRARVARASRALEQAKRSHARADQLAATGTLAPDEREQAELSQSTLEKDLESARFAARAAAFEREAVRFALLAAEADSRDATAGQVAVRAPVSGRVLRILQQSERSVAAGTPVVEIGDPGSLEIVVDLLSEDAVRVQSGAVMHIESGDGRRLPARIRTIEPAAFTKVSALGVEEQRVNVIADFDDSAGRLGDGYRVEASITVWEGEGLLKIPGGALFRRGSAWGVFVLERGRARPREVQVGHRNATEAEVLRGLEAGDVLLLYPSDRIVDGTRVRAAG
jgi:HlyD family secretion protein